MPKLICKNCGEVFTGWSISKNCVVCGKADSLIDVKELAASPELLAECLEPLVFKVLEIYKEVHGIIDPMDEYDTAEVSCMVQTIMDHQEGNLNREEYLLKLAGKDIDAEKKVQKPAEAPNA